MADVASIVIAVISSICTLLLGLAGLVYTRSTDERKARSEAEKLIAKYRDPLLLASHDLQSRLFNIVDNCLTSWLHGTHDEKENLRLYTAFLVGQYLSWTYVLRHQVQFLRFSTDRNEKNKRLGNILAEIAENFSSGSSAKGLSSAPFRLWRNQQMAIGELMTVSEGIELYCMGSAAFFHRYKQGLNHQSLREELNYGTHGHPSSRTSHHQEELAYQDQNEGLQISSQEFRDWFRPLIVGINEIASAKRSLADEAPDQRMRRLQHLLLDLMEILDLEHSGIGSGYTSRCHRARICSCTKCQGSQACPCSIDQKSECRYNTWEQPSAGRKVAVGKSLV